MKYNINVLLSLILIVCCFSSCKKKGSPSLGEAEINGESWQTGGHYTGLTDFPNDKFSILLSAGKYIKADDYFVANSQISIKQVPKNVGRYSLTQIPFSNYQTFDSDSPFAYFSTLWQSGEMFCAQYMIDTTDTLNNWISIDQQKNDFERVWGTFSMTLIRDTSVIQTPCFRNPYGDTIKVRNGKFYVKRDK